MHADISVIGEQRRRDRINEKMRALQELIPNCNKVLSLNICAVYIVILRHIYVMNKKRHLFNIKQSIFEGG